MERIVEFLEYLKALEFGERLLLTSTIWGLVVIPIAAYLFIRAKRLNKSVRNYSSVIGISIFAPVAAGNMLFEGMPILAVIGVLLVAVLTAILRVQAGRGWHDIYRKQKGLPPMDYDRMEEMDDREYRLKRYQEKMKGKDTSLKEN